MLSKQEKHEFINAAVLRLKEYGVTQTKLAKLLDIKTSNVNNWVAGRATLPYKYIDIILKIIDDITSAGGDSVASNPKNSAPTSPLLNSLRDISTERLTAELKRRGYTVVLTTS